MQPTTTAPATERALFDRLQRRLKRDGQQLHRCRETSRDFHNLGRYYITDASTRALLAADVDLADWLEVRA
jgi:hypothetical protein